MNSYRRMAIILTLTAFTFCSAGAQAQKDQTESNDRERAEALQLFEAHKMPEAAALLEKVAARRPNDVVVAERLGVALLDRASTQTDPAKRKADRLAARASLLHAKQLGDNSDLCRVLLDGIPEDGSESPFSTNTEVQAAMQRGEALFAKGDFDGAIAQYSLALQLDPKLYLAAVYAGDMYFRQHKPDQAGQWFARAIQIDPNQEVAYRYWGDTLLQQGRMKEARDKYIQGVVADPYMNTSWGGLNQWVRANGVTYNKIKIQLPTPPTTDEKGHTDLTMNVNEFNADSIGTTSWLAYSITRGVWQREKFASEFPNEKTYRHSLKEEVDGLSSAIAVFIANQKKTPQDKPDSRLLLLSKLKADGMLEPYVLLMLPDAGIAKDYPAYRAAHRDKLIAFVDKYLVPAAK
jgi:tetratricopeptide (TPR) repeat protein